jgi:type IV pilus assembly protein PilX
MKPGYCLKRHTQKGAVLIVGLLILLIMTIIGVTTMQTTRVEEKMAGNVRDRSLAFQAAESALRQAEDYVENLANVAGFNGSNGLYGLSDLEPINWGAPGSSVWTSSNSRAYTGPMENINTVPRYMIKIRNQGSGSLPGALNVQGYGKQKPASQAIIFRVTARGTGGTDQSQVFLQTHYGKLF